MVASLSRPVHPGRALHRSPHQVGTAKGVTASSKKWRPPSLRAAHILRLGHFPRRIKRSPYRISGQSPTKPLGEGLAHGGVVSGPQECSRSAQQPQRVRFGKTVPEAAHEAPWNVLVIVWETVPQKAPFCLPRVKPPRVSTSIITIVERSAKQPPNPRRARTSTEQIFIPFHIPVSFPSKGYSSAFQPTPSWPQNLQGFLVAEFNLFAIVVKIDSIKKLSATVVTVAGAVVDFEQCSVVAKRTDKISIITTGRVEPDRQYFTHACFFRWFLRQD